MSKILLADDHPIIRHATTKMLAAAFPGARIGEAVNTQTLLRHLVDSSWDIAIIDNALPGRMGLTLLGDIKQTFPQLPVLVMGIHPPDEFTQQMQAAGADMYLQKDEGWRKFVVVVRMLLAGKNGYIKNDIGWTCLPV